MRACILHMARHTFASNFASNKSENKKMEQISAIHPVILSEDVLKTIRELPE